MLAALWKDLFRRIPAAQQNQLILVTSTGLEIMVQKVVRLEEEYVVLRGRPAGSTEAGRVLFMPYDQISNLSINQVLKEADIHALFGTIPAAEIGAPLPEVRATKEESVQTPEPEEPEEPKPPPTKITPELVAKVPPPSKSILLARVRARLKDAEKGP